MTLKIVFAGTPEFASEILATLLASTHRVLGVYTQPDRPFGRGLKLHASAVKTLALKHSVPIYQPRTLKDQDAQAILRNLAPDLLIVVAYGLILPEAVLTIPKYGCINIHASLLPRWRGAAPIQHAILTGDATTGISMMQMDAGLDTGAVFSWHTCSISPDDTSHTLQNKLATLGAHSLLETLSAFDRGDPPMPQKQNPDQATYAPKITKADAKIHWGESAVMIDRKIRAFNPSPIAFTTYHDYPIRIWEAKPTKNISSQTPGRIVNIDKDFIEAATGEGTLRLFTLQLPGGKALPVRDILNSKRELFQANVSIFT